MKNTIRIERMTWIVQVILLLVIFSLSVILVRILKIEYIKQHEKQKISQIDNLERAWNLTQNP